MPTLRIAAQIGPIRLARIEADRASPGDGFAAHRYDGAHAQRQGAVPIDGQEFLVAAESVARQRCRESLLVSGEISDGTGLQLGRG